MSVKLRWLGTAAFGLVVAGATGASAEIINGNFVGTLSVLSSAGGQTAVTFPIDGSTGDFGLKGTLDTVIGPVKVEVSGNIDPGLVFNIAYTDPTPAGDPPTAFFLSLSIPITPITGLVSVFGDWTGGITDAIPPGDGGIIFGLPPTNSFVDFDINGVIVLSTGPSSFSYTDAATPFGTNSGSIVIDCDDPIFGTEGCTSISTGIGLSGSNFGDGFVFTTTLTVLPVAEPVTLSVLGLGLISLAGALRRARQTA